MAFFKAYDMTRQRIAAMPLVQRNGWVIKFQGGYLINVWGGKIMDGSHARGNKAGFSGN